MSLVSKPFGDLITFSRATGGGRFNASGQYEWLPANEPRIDYDPVTGECRGILIEEQRTNLLLRSAELDNVAWTKHDVSVVANAATAPDGTMTADKLIESATKSEHYLQSTGIATNTSLPHTFSFYFRSGEKPYVRVTVYDSVIANSFRCELDVNNAAIVAGTVTVAGTASNASASVVSVGGGVYRFLITGIPASSNSGSLYAARISLLSNDRATNNYTGDGTSGIYIWGAQLEAGAFPTSYIPTTTAQVTRAADLCSVDTLSPWYRADEGTLLVEAVVGGQIGVDPVAVAGIGDGSGGNRIQLRVQTNTIAALRVSSGGQSYNEIISSANLIGGLSRLAASFSPGVQSFSVKGLLAKVGTPVSTMPFVSRLEMGRGAASSLLTGHIRRVRYIPRRISDTELKSLTAI